MKIVPGNFSGWLNLQADFSELDMVKRIPVRRFDSKTKLWSVPDTKRVRDYLERCGVAVEVPERTSTETLPPPRFKTTPRAHQADNLALMEGKHAFGILDEPGTGKTKVTIDDATRWFDAGQIQAVIVVCPNSITGNWMDEIDIHSPVPSDKHGYDSAKKAQAQRWIGAEAPEGHMRWFIMAVESLSSKAALDAALAFAKKHRCILAVDESTRIKTHNANRTKNIIKLAKLCPIRRILTGTMLTKSLEGAWSQFEVLDPRILGMDFYPFRGYFCVMGGYQMKNVVASKNEADFFDIIKPWVSLKKKSDCLDLPPKVYQKRTVAPTKAILDLYNDVLSGTVTDPSFSVAMVRDLRLHQITGGFYYKLDEQKAMSFLLREMEALATGGEMPDPDELDKTYISVRIEGPNPKVDEVLNIAEDIPGKMVVWCRYRAELNEVAEALRANYGDSAVVEFHGGVPKEDRQPIIRSFQEDPGIRFFVGQQNTGGIGITLTAASVMVFFSNDWSGENRIQAEDRIHRISQGGESCLYIDIVFGGDNTPPGGYLDSKVLRAVQQGKDYHAFVQDQIQSRQEISCAGTP